MEILRTMEPEEVFLGEEKTSSWRDLKYKQTLLQLAAEACLIQYLPPRHRFILEQRCFNATLGDVTKQLFVTRERVRQIEAKSVTLLEMMLRGELIPENGIAVLPRARKSVVDIKLGFYPREALMDLIVNQGLTPEEAAWKIGCSKEAVTERMHKWMINRVVVVQDNKLVSSQTEKLRTWFVKENLTNSDVAEKLGCSISKVKKLKREHSIYYKSGAKKKRQELSKKLGENPKEILIKMYQEFTLEKIAKILECSLGTVVNLFKESNIKRRLPGPKKLVNPS